MIAIEEVMPMLVEACPSFKETFVGLNAFHGEIVSDILMDDFADHIFDLYKNGNSDEFQEVFQVIEKIKSEGDEAARELVLTCFFGEIDHLVDRARTRE